MKHLKTRGFYALLIAVVAISLACRAGLSQNDPGPSRVDTHDGSATINVVARDFTLSLDADEAKAGRVTFLIHNQGSMHHDFAIRGNGVEQKTPMIEPGDSAPLTVELEPGTYRYICTVSGHEQAGMSGTLTVTSN